MISLPVDDARRVALLADDAVPNMLLEVDFSAAVGGVQRMTDAPRDIVSDGETFLAHQGVSGLSAVQPQGVSDRDLLEVVFEDPEPGDASWYHRFTSQGYTGISASLGVVFEADDGTLSSRLAVYAGRCVSVVLDGEDSRVVVARFSGPFASRSGNPVLATDAAQRGRDAGDISLQLIAVSRNIQWGRQIPRGWELSHPEGA